MIKKCLICVVIFIFLLTINNNSVYAELENKKLLQDTLLTTLNPYIYEAVQDYYEQMGEQSRSYDLYDAKILQLHRERPGEFSFFIVIQINTFVGPHNPPYGIEIISLKVTPSKIQVINYLHRDKE
jgi:hypothetical protein